MHILNSYRRQKYERIVEYVTANPGVSLNEIHRVFGTGSKARIYTHSIMIDLEYNRRIIYRDFKYFPGSLPHAEK